MDVVGIIAVLFLLATVGLILKGIRGWGSRGRYGDAPGASHGSDGRGDGALD